MTGLMRSLGRSPNTTAMSGNFRFCISVDKRAERAYQRVAEGIFTVEMSGLRLEPSASESGLPVIEVPPGQSKTVGRGRQADFNIDDASLSRLHARVTAEPDGLLAIDDLGSTNGIVINGREQLSSYLRAGDIVRFGRVEYVVTGG